ncbi:DUF2920 family protein [Campylobacter sp. faydin G-105]|uniref:DUF2920 family protein n=1 Tax=Campylobacter anatolicus TaxID=2829105 RepID=UPI001BA32159|nr:DUF2920 family protein [Campylobacter anatolicus]
MIVNKTYEIDSCDDAELGIKRNYPLEFRVCFDDDKDIKAIVFIVPGLGGDAESIGDKVIFEDQIHYTIVKNTTFNGIKLPDLLLLKSDGELKVVRKFGYEQYRDRN